MTECNDGPSPDWQRRWNIGMILRHYARHPDDPTPLPVWITESPDTYATLKRPLPESKLTKYTSTTRITVAIHGTNLPSTTPTNYPSESRSQDHKNRPKFSPPPSPFLKTSEMPTTIPVTVTSTPINADDIICIEDKTLWSRKSKEHTIESSSPPSPQTAPASAVTDDNEEETGWPQRHQRINTAW